ncbi:MAG TPA: response regulator transcription factor [Bacilli bacterium]|nr:response regulator transcription factor [Bacilli bacterium]
MKILIIEDEYNLADVIKSILTKEKYDSKVCTDGELGYEEALTNIYDLIILDVMLPHMNGFEILKELKNNNINSKIIMLTAKSTIEDKMNGFNNGADDYLTKPFHMDELLARVNIQLRKTTTNNTLSIGDIELDITTLNLKNIKNNSMISVIGKEFQLLEMFMKSPNQVMNKEQLFTKIWGYESDCELNTLEAYISFLRKKLKNIDSNVTIKAIRNMGYRLEIKDEKIKD